MPQQVLAHLKGSSGCAASDAVAGVPEPALAGKAAVCVDAGRIWGAVVCAAQALVDVDGAVRPFHPAGSVGKVAERCR